MAKKKALTRFYVRHSGFNAELFAVRERSDGDLILKHCSVFHERTLFRPSDSDRSLEDRYSVHVSPKTDGHTITHTKIMERHPSHRNMWFVTCKRGAFLTKIYSRRHTSLIERLFKMPESAKDRQVCVAEFDVTKSTLVTHVFVGARNGVQLDKIGLPWDVVSHQFRLFTLYVVKGFIPYPSLEQGDHAEPPDGTEIPTMTAEVIPSIIERANELLCRLHRPRAMTQIMNAMTSELDKWPIGAVMVSGPIHDRVIALGTASRVERRPLE